MRNQLIVSTLLILYIVALITVLIFKNVPTIHLGMVMLNFGGVNEGAANLIPFKTILPYLLGEKGWLIGGLNILGNVIVLVPLGFLVPSLDRNMRVGKAWGLAFVSGLVIETAQLLLRVGRFDIDDVILNGLGVMLGYLIYNSLKDETGNINGRKFIAVFAAALVCMAGLIFFIFSPRPDSSDRRSVGFRGEDLAGKDPCGGTGGLGPIIVLGKNSITVRRGDDVEETVFINDQTKIASSKGEATQGDLKLGDRVTVVVMSDDKVANAVMICNTATSPK